MSVSPSVKKEFCHEDFEINELLVVKIPFEIIMPPKIQDIYFYRNLYFISKFLSSLDFCYKIEVRWGFFKN